MLKVCGDSIWVSLEVIFKQALLTGVFLLNGKMEILFPFIKRVRNKILKIIAQFLYFRFVVKYLKDLLLTKCLTISPLINFFKNQSGFEPGDSCINQLLSITNKIFAPFDNGLEVRSVFLDISKAFDKVWHEGLIFKMPFLVNFFSFYLTF